MKKADIHLGIAQTLDTISIAATATSSSITKKSFDMAMLNECMGAINFCMMTLEHARDNLNFMDSNDANVFLEGHYESSES